MLQCRPTRGVVLLFFVLLTLWQETSSVSAFASPPPARGDVEEVDYYKIMGLEDLRENATEKDIKQRFRKLSKQYHPDVATDTTEDAKAFFTKIQRANEVLSDKRRRKMYDMRGEEGLQMLEKHLAAGEPQEQNPFAQFFGEAASNSFKGPDAEVQLTVSLADFFTGGERVLTLNKRKVCPACRGKGHPHDVQMHVCRQCGGQGAIRQRVQFAPGLVQEVMQQCPACEGRGRIPAHRCPRCRGHRLVEGTSELVVQIEKGAYEGQVVTFEMEGEEQIDRLPGDLKVVLRSEPHPRFRRRARGAWSEDPKNFLDLETTLKITLKEALLGFQHTIRHLDDKEEVVVEREKGQITPHGWVIRIPGKGMPRLHVPSERGDLYVVIAVTMPSTLTAEQREWVEKNL